MARAAVARPKPFWERAYKGHAYWLGKAKLGKVTLISGSKGKYHWEAGGRAGYTDEPGQGQRDASVSPGADVPVSCHRRLRFRWPHGHRSLHRGSGRRRSRGTNMGTRTSYAR